MACLVQLAEHILRPGQLNSWFQAELAPFVGWLHLGAESVLGRIYVEPEFAPAGPNVEPDLVPGGAIWSQNPFQSGSMPGPNPLP